VSLLLQIGSPLWNTAPDYKHFTSLIHWLGASRSHYPPALRRAKIFVRVLFDLFFYGRTTAAHGQCTVLALPEEVPACTRTQRAWLRWYLECNGSFVDIAKPQVDTPLTVTHF
jgi:hypothetical protein